jgi:membrane protease YdiL (CAAX protease family)
MLNTTHFLKRHSLVAGILLMFLLTWPIDFANSGVLPVKVPQVVSLTFGWGIIFASLIMTGVTLGRGAVIALLRRFLLWRVNWVWYLIAFLLYPAVFSTAVLARAALTQTGPDFSSVMAHDIFGASANLPVLIIPFFLVDLFANGEEMGWRGYVLPRLQARHSALVSSLIVGVVWGFWHLPRYLAPEHTGSFPLLMVKAMADSVIYTWLYNNTRGSLLLTAILHAAGNTAGVFLPMANTLSGANMDVYVLAAAFLILIAVTISVSARRARPRQAELIQAQN